MANVKKGEAQTALLVKMITVLTLGIVLFVLIKNTGTVNVNIAEKSTCKESVQQYAKLRIPGIDLASTDQIKCPVQLKTINPSDDGRAKKLLADAMFDCFDQFGAGELELFETRRASTDHYCVVCSKITFTEIDKNLEIKGFADHLSEEFVPGKKVTYFQYFKGDTVAKGEATTVTDMTTGTKTPDALKSTPLDIDTSIEHAVLFTYSKSTGWWDKIVAAEVAGTVGIVVGGAVAGFFTGGVGWVVAGAALAGGTGVGFGLAKAPSLDSDWQAGVILLPYNKDVRDYLKCDEVPIKQ